MPQIPGLGPSSGGGTSGIPGLGPAPPAGGGLPDFTNAPSTGIPGLSGGGSTGIPGMPAATPSPTLPTASRTPVLSPTRIASIDDGMAIIQRVKNRELTWQQANALISTMSDKDRNELMRRLQTMPGTGPDELLAVAGKGHHANILGGILSTGAHLIEDTRGLVTGAPAGIGLQIAAPIRDAFGLFNDPVGTLSQPGKSHIYKDIAVPTAKGLATSATLWSKIVTDPQEFEREVGAHPLQPLLDIAGAASVGAGTGLRIAAYNDLGRALRVTMETDFAHPTRPDVIANVSLRDLRDPQGIPSPEHQAALEAFDQPGKNFQYGPTNLPRVPYYVKPSAEDLAARPWMRSFSVLYDRTSGKAYFSPVGHSHDELYDIVIHKATRSMGRELTPQESHDLFNDPNLVQGRGTFDDSGNINVNMDDPHNLTYTPDEVVDATHRDGGIVDQAKELYLPIHKYKDLLTEHVTPPEMKWPRGRDKEPAVAVVGGVQNGMRVWQLKSSGLYIVKDAKGKHLTGRFTTADAAIRHAQSLVTPGVDARILTSILHPQTIPHEMAPSFERAQRANEGLTFEHYPVGSLDEHAIDTMINETNQWGVPDERINTERFQRETGEYTAATEASMAHGALEDARGGTYLPPQDSVIVRDPSGGLVTAASYHLDWAGNRVVHLSHVGSKTPGAGLAAVAEIARRHPGYAIDFASASDRIAAYYRKLGFQETRPPNPAGPPGREQRGSREFVISAEEATRLARGEYPIAPVEKLHRAVEGEVNVPMTKGEVRRAGLSAAITPGPRGRFIDIYKQAMDVTDMAAITQLAEEISKVADDPNLSFDKPTIRQVFRQIKADLAETRAQGQASVGKMVTEQPAWYNPTGSRSAARLIKGAGSTLRELSDLVRAGTVFLRPAYLPNNWVSNEFLNLSDQGIFAPYNLARVYFMHKHLDPRQIRIVQTAMGFNPTEVLMGGGRGRGYIASVTDPVANLMGKIGDEPFREAQFIMEARRAGYKTLPQLKQLLDDVMSTDGRVSSKARLEVARLGNNGQEAIVKFGHLNEKERSIFRGLIFVYSWMRGAARFFGRFPLQHPVQSAYLGFASQQGNEWLAQAMGGTPSFLIGAIPVGRDSDGNPILVNPFNVNPLGTGLQEILAAQATYNAAIHPTQFNKYINEDVVGLMNPLIQSYVQSREGGKAALPGTFSNIAGYRLYKGLTHPGSGSVFPGTRQEAVGRFTFGSLYPTKANQAAITRSLERENRDNPEALIPNQIADYKKATGQDIPKDLVQGYTQDLRALQQEKDFKRSYASDHGSQGFTNLPPENRAEAAIQYLSKYHLVAPDDIQSMKDQLAAITTDAEFTLFGNTLWSMTGTGTFKRAWQDLMKTAKAETRSRKRQ